MLNTGLTVVEDKTYGIDVRGKGDSYLLGSIENLQIVRGLCASHKYHTSYHFLTYTGNHKNHFGTKILKNGLMALNGNNIILFMKIFLFNIKNKSRNNLSNLLVIYFC